MVGTLSPSGRSRPLSRNAIAGKDDPAILKELYDELESVEWRQYTGLDDKALDLLKKVDVRLTG
ncbi:MULTISPECIES: hypothetical protein [unclassified Streptomyces]|uniref:hypothetical protein n=1 Tax=unclassified Streptomyces TaxID=2593676 RepID=UPI002366A515|nr:MULTISPECIES: hypothetical protein [unclassified Streptomyces]MDF3142048.1 hypothetical protein [Streptomyces sp. T21Q-yed]WDF36196.1 hypothetical protein PBV52_05130 [Streptomyces sp. T12]